MEVHILQPRLVVSSRDLDPELQKDTHIIMDSLRNLAMVPSRINQAV